MNNGEFNELLVKIKLVLLRDRQEQIEVGGKKLLVESVGFKGREYSALPLSVDLNFICINNISQIANALNMSKAGRSSKADVEINGTPFSIKSLEKAPPALVNHTARNGWERICNSCGFDITKLDAIVAEYWNLRLAGIITEDISNASSNSPFSEHDEYLKPILNYFLFKGSGSQDSTLPAKYILSFINPLNTATWKIYGEEYIDLVWNRLIFSMRSKKGMGNYPNIRNRAAKVSMEKWTKYHQNEYRGALHVRVK